MKNAMLELAKTAYTSALLGLATVVAWSTNANDGPPFPCEMQEVCEKVLCTSDVKETGSHIRRCLHSQESCWEVCK